MKIVKLEAAPPPVALAVAKQQCRVPDAYNDEDVLFSVYIAAAGDAAEIRLGRRLLPTILRAEFLTSHRCCRLGPDVRSIDRVTLLADSGPLELSSEQWRLDSGGCLVLLGDLPAVTAQVEFTAGAWLDADDLAARAPAVFLWLLQSVVTMYVTREPVARDSALDGLLDSERYYGN